MHIRFHVSWTNTWAWNRWDTRLFTRNGRTCPGPLRSCFPAACGAPAPHGLASAHGLSRVSLWAGARRRLPVVLTRLRVSAELRVPLRPFAARVVCVLNCVLKSFARQKKKSCPLKFKSTLRILYPSSSICVFFSHFFLITGSHFNFLYSGFEELKF